MVDINHDIQSAKFFYYLSMNYHTIVLKKYIKKLDS